MHLRRALAALLFVAALALALRPAAAGAEPTSTVLVAASDIAAGSSVTVEDVRTAAMPSDLVPDGALTSAEAADGRILTAAARAGEPLTDTRLVGARGQLRGDPDAAAVPVRLSDDDIAELLHPGATVDVVTKDVDDDLEVIAEQATVVTVTAADDEGFTATGSGRLVLIAVPAEQASEVAATALHQPVTVTLR